MKKVIFALFLAVFAQNVFSATMSWDASSSAGVIFTANNNSDQITAYKGYDSHDKFNSGPVQTVDFVFKTDGHSTINSVAIEFFDSQIKINSVKLLGGASPLSFAFSTDGLIGTWSLGNTALTAGLHTIRALVASAQNGAQLNVKINAVPVPGAVWLFGSALMGLVGVSRRKASVNGLSA